MKEGIRMEFAFLTTNMSNASVDALMEVQKAFQGVADDLGLDDEQDVVDMVKQIRAERGGNYQCE